MSKIIPLTRTLSGSSQQSIFLDATSEGADGYNPVSISTNILLPLASNSDSPSVYTSNGDYVINTPEGYYGIGRFVFKIQVPQPLPLYTYSAPITYTANGDYFVAVPSGYSGITSPSIHVRVPEVLPEDSKIEIYSVADRKGSTVPLERMSVAPANQLIALSAYQVGLYIQFNPKTTDIPFSFYRIVWRWSTSGETLETPAGSHWTRFSSSSGDPPQAIIFYDILDNPVFSYGNTFALDDGNPGHTSYLETEGHASIFSNALIKFPWTE